MTARDQQLVNMGLPTRNPFDFRGPSTSGLGYKPPTQAAKNQNARYWRDKEKPTPTEKVLVVNAESNLGYSHRKAADRTLSIGRVSSAALK